MVVKKAAPNPSPSPDEAKMRPAPTQGPAEPKLSPDPAMAQRPGRQGKGARRR
jgi:hypothetical protein